MNNNRIFVIGAVAAMVIIIAFSYYKMSIATMDKGKYNVSVIIEDSNNDRWLALKEGMSQAGIDYGIGISFVSTKECLKADETTDLIQRELNHGAEGIIVEPTESEAIAKYLENQNIKNQIVLMGSDILPQGVYYSVHAEDENVGEIMAQNLINDYGANLENMTVGILAAHQEQMASADRLNSFYRELEKSVSLNVRWTLYNSDGLGTTLQEYMKESPVDIIVAFGNPQTEAAISVRLTAERAFDIYGLGYSEKAVYYLDQGIVKSLVVPDDFNMGYLAVEKMSQLLNHSNAKRETLVDTIIVNEGNLYDEDIAKSIFPIIQ